MQHLVERFLHFLIRRKSTPGAILCYHGVVESGQESDSVLHVNQEEFQQTLELIRSTAEIVPLSDILRRRERGDSTHGMVALTFDDAYVSIMTPGVLDHAAATVFVSPGLLGTHPWWDRLDELHARCSQQQWRALEDEVGVSSADRGPEAMHYGPVGPVRNRLVVHHAGRLPAISSDYLTELENEVEVPRRQRIMTWEDLEVLVKKPGVDLGVHTITHPALPYLADEEIIREVRVAHGLLRERFDRVAPVLAAPFGLHDTRVLKRASDAGMTATLTLEGCTLGGPGPLHGTPRICMVHGDPPQRQQLRLAGLTERIPRPR